MPPVQADVTTNTLDAVIANFRHWRAHRTRRGKVPLELMEQAASLVEQYPVSRITLALGLDFTLFKRYCQQRGLTIAQSTSRSKTKTKTKTKYPTPAFVEVQPPIVSAPEVDGNLALIQIELRRSDGAAMRIHCTQTATVQSCIAQFLQG